METIMMVGFHFLHGNVILTGSGSTSVGDRCGKAGCVSFNRHVNSLVALIENNLPAATWFPSAVSMTFQYKQKAIKLSLK